MCACVCLGTCEAGSSLEGEPCSCFLAVRVILSKIRRLFRPQPLSDEVTVSAHSWSGHRNANGASQVAERGAGLWCPGPPTCARGQPSSQESCSGPGPEAPEPPCHLLAQALVTERPRLLSLCSKGQVLGSKQAELALGGVSKKGIFFFFGNRSGAHQAFGRLPRNGWLLEWSWRGKQGGQCLIFKQEML